VQISTYLDGLVKELDLDVAREQNAVAFKVDHMLSALTFQWLGIVDGPASTRNREPWL